ncbi:MAG: hypothetical protein GX455_16765 [Phycisphaerae bacterium]|nr:hypothetical protein [Phycisphaerae bacterium]
MNRREFISISGATLWGLSACSRENFVEGPIVDSGSGIRWRRHEQSGLFETVSMDGHSLVHSEEGVGLVDGFCSIVEEGKPGREVRLTTGQSQGKCGPIRISLDHRVQSSTRDSSDDLLEATLTLQSLAEKPCQVYCGFLSGVRPCRNVDDQQVYVPISAAGLGDPENDKRRRMKDCHQTVRPDGFLAHYLEPQACDPHHSTTRVPLLAPVVDLFAENGPCRVAFFGSSTEPIFFQAKEGDSFRAWRLGRLVRLEPGLSQVVRVFLFIHSGDAAEAWSFFHQFGHKEDFPAVSWTNEVRVHYYDFLSSVAENGPRGGGYDLDLGHFGEFHVGLATQHGYYLSYGDFIHPDRKEWKAMPNDTAGPVTMTLEKIRARVDATRKAGVHPGIYMHYTILDEGSPLFEKMRDSIRVDANGNPTPFGWEGPDVIKKTWRMSHTSDAWRDHLIRQAQWIMELFNPDAIVLDETFSAWGYDYHKGHGGPLSRGGIELMRKLRQVVRSFGPDKALLASDCSMANFCLWGDGEAGDHCYDRLLGHELYRKPPIRYMAALGSKAWLPCAWLYKSLWPAQVDLARKVGAAVSVTNGWGDAFGLTRLPEDAREQMLRDIETMVK